MKKCPKCGKVHDDSWGICANCMTPLAKDLSLKPTNPELAKPKKMKISILGIMVGWLLGTLASAVYKSVVFSLFPPPLPPKQAGHISNGAFIVSAGFFIGGYYLVTKLLSRKIEGSKNGKSSSALKS